MMMLQGWPSSFVLKISENLKADLAGNMLLSTVWLSVISALMLSLPRCAVDGDNGKVGNADCMEALALFGVEGL